VGLTLIVPSDTGSNQPEKYGVQLIALAYWHVRPTNYRVSVLKPKIDRLSVTFAVAAAVTRKMILQQLNNLAESNDPRLTNWKKHKGWGSGKYSRSFGLHLGKNQIALVQCVPINPAVSFLRFEFNPNAVGRDAVMVFQKLLPEITAGAVTYDLLAQLGKVTRADIAVDFVNIDIEDLLISTSKPGKTKAYFSLSGKAETKYLNVNKKGSNLYLYDRKALLQELAEGGGKPSEFGQAPYTRVEFRTQPNVPIVELPKMHNRLKKINLMDMEAATPPEQEHHWKLFQNSCRYCGMSATLALLPDSIRTAYAAAIAAADTELWKPDKLWGLWPEAVAKSGLLPAKVDGDQ
jgi:hypothetical protein